MRSNHTSGPWRIGEQYRVADIKAGHNALVARVELDAGDKGYANARLIAAAPDLLAALIALVAANNCNYTLQTMRYEGLFKTAQDAIDRAEK